MRAVGSIAAAMYRVSFVHTRNNVKCCSFQVQEYKDSLKQKAEHLIIKGFPEKIVKLNELLETSNFRNRDLADVHQVINSNIENAVSLSCKFSFFHFFSYMLGIKIKKTQKYGREHTHNIYLTQPTTIASYCIVSLY